jgi:beta-aspartyl-peptidase (threonine type)
MVKGFIIGTRNSGEFLYAGADILKRGGSALDAVEAATRLVEANPEDTTVGMGGIPNILGIQEMDASIMDGKTLKAGAVGAVKGYLYPITIARKVLDNAPHVMLVGEGAELFAEALGCEKGDLSTERSRLVYDLFRKQSLEDIPDDERYKQGIIEYVDKQNLYDWYDKLSDENHGTVNIMAMDNHGNIASAVSTSGTALKFPGRLGDSPIIGAGNYCDNRYGAAACTGRGELAIRNSTARSIISYMENGLSVKEACFRAMKDIHELKSPGGMNCIAFDAKGNTISATTREDRESIHWYLSVEMDEPEQRTGINVKA